MRGQRTLFEDMFGNKASAKISQDKQRPRNVLMPERNNLLIYRYYYHAHINKMQFEHIMEQLEKEFFIVTARIVVVLTDNDNHLRTIVSQKPEIKELKKLFPHMNWEYNPR